MTTYPMLRQTRLVVSGFFSFLLASACVDTGVEPSGSGGASGATTVGGTASTGGSAPVTGTSAGGSAPVTGTTADMRDITSMELVKEMGLGWNLGNTLDANPTETSWGNPLTTQAMIDTVKAAGFNTVRVPVTWMHHLGAEPDYLVDETWMARVEEIVDYVLSNNLFAILNTHHDSWVSVMPTADQTAVSTKLTKLWTQIATRFRDYDDHLVFEVLNEPRTTDETEWTGGTAAARTLINAYNLAAVNAIRATGGNNQLRHIMVPTHAANPSSSCIQDLVIPNQDAKIIVSLHTYSPYEFSFGKGISTWGSDEDQLAMTAELDRIYAQLPATGRAVVIGEWGTVNQSNTSARSTHAGAYAEAVVARGMACIWWDNGGMGSGSDSFGLLDRRAVPPSWAYPTITEALVSGAAAGAASTP